MIVAHAVASLVLASAHTSSQKLYGTNIAIRLYECRRVLSKHTLVDNISLRSVFDTCCCVLQNTLKAKEQQRLKQLREWTEAGARKHVEYE